MGVAVQQTIAQKTIAGMQYGGSTVAAGGGLMAFLNENAQAIGAIVGLGGLCVAVAGFGVGWLYKHKHYKLAEMEKLGQLEDRVREKIKREFDL